MNRRKSATYLAGILCAAAHGQLLSKPVPKVQGAPKRTCEALRDFATRPFQDAEATPKNPLQPCGSLEHYKFLLAMVPDPINTHLALFFDRTVESIENAVGDLGWEFARYNFPWDPLLAKEEPDADKRQKQKDERSEQEREPGVLLFRNRNDLKQHLAIFLIAETPTAGLERVQFEAAWKYMGLEKKCATVQLIGPTFSGSFHSIRELGDCRRLIAFSGTASSAPALQEFDNNGGLLHTFIHSDEWAEFQLTNHIRKEWGNEGPIAILAEGETAFGTSFRASSGARKDRDIVDVFRFPREISHLRNAYAPVPDLSGATKQPVQSGQSVPLDLRDIGTGHDSIPSLSAQMALSQEAALFSIGSQLRQKRYSFVGVLASNILDAVFLSRYLRAICPDSRVFVFDQDLLFTRASAESPLYGTVSVATYSVLIANQRNSTTYGARLQFPNQAAEGIYNATTAALVNAGLADAKSPGVKLLDYSFPGRSTGEGKSARPPLWITVLGRNAYWPVAVVDSTAEETMKDCPRLAESSAVAGITKATAISLAPEAPGAMWSFLFVGASFALIGFAVALWLGQFDAGFRSPRWPASLFVQNEGSENPLGRIYYLYAFAVAAALTYAILAAPYWLLTCTFGQPFMEWFKICTSSVAVLAILAVIIWCTRLLITYRRPPSMHISEYYVMAGATMLLTVVLFVLIFWAFLQNRPHEEHIFAAWRSLDLFNGVAPATPCILAGLGLCCWAWVHFRRLVIFEERRPPLPTVDFEPLTFQLAGLQSRVENAIRNPFMDGRVRCAGAAIILVTMFIGELNHVQTFESKQYEYLYLLLLGLLLAALSLSFWRCMLIWSCVRRFLEQLELHPIRHAISDLRPEMSWTPFLQHGLAKQRGGFEMRMVEAAEKLSDEGSSSIDSSQLADATKTFINLLGRGERIPTTALEAIRTETRRLYNPVVQELLGEWGKGQSELLEKLDPGSTSAGLRPVARRHQVCSEFIALPFVYFVRISLLQMRNMGNFLTLGFVLAWLSLNSYPFQAPRMLNGLMILVFLVIGTGAAIVFAQVSKDAILSRISSTTPGKLDRSFFIHLVTAGGLPLTTVVLSQFPAVSRFLFSWIEPTLQAVK